MTTCWAEEGNGNPSLSTNTNSHSGLSTKEIIMLTSEELIDAVIEYVRTMSSEDRLDFINKCMEGFCEECGTKHTPSCRHPRYDR